MVVISHEVTLTIVHGFLASGKSTWSAKQASVAGALRLNADEYCEQNFSAEQLEADWNRCFSKAVEDLWSLTERKLLTGQSVILDFGFWDRASRDKARNVAGRLKVGFRHIYLTASDEAIQARLSERSGYIAQKNIQNYNRLKLSFTEPEEDEVHEVIVTSAI